MLCTGLNWLQMKILLMLNQKPMYGYEIMKELGLEIGKQPSPGTIYPALNSMCNKGLIKMSKIEGEILPRKVYRLDEEGLKHVKDLYYTLVTSCCKETAPLISGIIEFIYEKLELCSQERKRLLYVGIEYPELIEIVSEFGIFVSENVSITIIPRFGHLDLPENIEIIPEFEDVNKIEEKYFNAIFYLHSADPLIPRLGNLEDVLQKFQRVLTEKGRIAVMFYEETECPIIKVLLKTALDLNVDKFGGEPKNADDTILKHFEIKDEFVEKDFRVVIGVQRR